MKQQLNLMLINYSTSNAIMFEKKNDCSWICLSFDKVEVGQLLRDHVKNLVNLVSDVSRTFHFVRYGPNVLKLRFNAKHRKAHKTIASRTLRYCASHDLNVTVDDYQPQIDRYGGPYGMEIAERQFGVSSTIVLDLISNRYADNGFNRGFDKNLGIQLALATVASFGLSSQDALEFFSGISKGWLAFLVRWRFSNTGDHSLIIKRLQQAHRKSYATQKDVLDLLVNTVLQQLSKHEFRSNPWLALWCLEHRKIYSELLKLLIDGKLLLMNRPLTKEPIDDLSAARFKLWPIIESYIHLTNNRLGIDVMDEPYLAYVITQTLAVSNRVPVLDDLSQELQEKPSEVFVLLQALPEKIKEIRLSPFAYLVLELFREPCALHDAWDSCKSQIEIENEEEAAEVHRLFIDQIKQAVEARILVEVKRQA
jgi:thiopeptide-type bacteriocin biosynthesis protein